MEVEDTLIIIRRKIKVKRMLKGWTQRRLAEEVKVGADYINRIETGKRTPTLVTLIRIAYALGTQPFKLLKQKSRRKFIKESEVDSGS